MSPEKIRRWLHFLAIYYWKCSHRCPLLFDSILRGSRRMCTWIGSLMSFCVRIFVFRSGPRCRLPHKLHPNEWRHVSVQRRSVDARCERVLSFVFNWFDWIMASTAHTRSLWWHQPWPLNAKCTPSQREPFSLSPYTWLQLEVRFLWIKTSRKMVWMDVAAVAAQLSRRGTQHVNNFLTFSLAAWCGGD